MKFIVDSMLGRLARWLRLFGYDAEYFRSGTDSELIYESIKGRRIILTRDRRISSKKPLKVLYIKSENLTEQLRQAADELKISFDRKKNFTRCIDCNAELVGIEKGKVKDRVPDFIYESQKDFSYCPGCKKIYWKGSHLKLAEKVIEKIC